MPKPSPAEQQRQYREYVRHHNLMRLQRKHGVTKEQSDEQMKRFLNDTLELFSKIGIVYESPGGVTVCSLRGKR